MRDRQLATRRQSLALLFGVLIDASCKAQKASTPAAPVLGTSLADPTARRFYQLRGGSPAWDAGKAQSLEQAVAGAQAHGLDPAAFAPKPATNQDEGLTLCALAYAKALAFGVVEPQRIHSVFTLERNDPDLASGLAEALQQDDPAAWLTSLAPADEAYEAFSGAYLQALNASGLAKAPVQGAPIGQSLAPADQARQLAVNLERRRWLTRATPEHRIDVNTAAAFLEYFKPDQAPARILTVVGREDHQTPSIQGQFHRLVANPPWRVPMDIARKEIFPKGAGYMRREGMRWVNGRLEQRPGPRSALGLVKFDVEDPYDIYLHDTPSKRLFAAPDRHLSHGCVRVQNAVDFARQIAGETSRGDAFEAALASDKTRAVELRQTIAVRMLYHTAYLDEGGQLLLAPDIYGADDRLAAALGLRQAAAAAQAQEPAALLGP
jgi:murein L,D-transpeptidase YcbB/YkuD